MKFCRNCGEEIKVDAKFCKHCGYDLEAEKVKGENVERMNQKPSSDEIVSKEAIKNMQKEPIKLSMKSKVFLGVSVALIIFLFIGYKVGDSLTSHKRMTEKFETALLEKDAKTLGHLLTSETKSLKINEDTVKGFIDYYSNNPSEMNNLFTHLKDQGYQYDQDSDYIASSNSYYVANLVKKGKKFIYDNYEIQVSPVYFDVGTNYSDTVISIDGEEIATTTNADYSKEFGPYLPGTYHFSAVYKSDFVELSTEADYTNFDPEYTDEVYLYIDGEEVSFDVANKDGLSSVALFIDGEDIGINLIEKDTIGPVLTDGSMNVSFTGEFPWGTLLTEEIPLDNDYMDVNFSLTDENKQELQDALVQYNKEYLAAYTSGDVSDITTVTDEVKTRFVQGIEYDKENDKFYKAKFIGIDFDNDSYSIGYYDDQWRIDVDTITYIEEDSYSPNYNPELELTESEISYQLVYDLDSKTWLVNGDGWPGYMDDADMTEYREEEPETYTSAWEWFEENVE